AKPPCPPALKHLATLNITLAPPIPVGPGPRGIRNIYTITGGDFKGASLSGTIPPFGGDWGLTDPSTGVFSADTRFQFHTSDGADIFVFTNGPQQPEGVLHVRVAFETGHPTYYWLNNIAAVGIVEIGPGIRNLTINTWQILSPK
ncbi:hypothetical protein B0H63DRAFT_379075, partial [Podospora didyma]